MADRKKVEDYKGLVKILDKQLEDAEEEVARLKHQMRQMTLLYNDAAGGDRYRGLTLEQMQYVDQFVINLKEGRTEVSNSCFFLHLLTMMCIVAAER